MHLVSDNVATTRFTFCKLIERLFLGVRFIRKTSKHLPLIQIRFELLQRALVLTVVIVISEL